LNNKKFPIINSWREAKSFSHTYIFFFFDKSKEYIKKAQRGATPITLGGEKIRKTNHPQGQPARCPGENGKKKKMEKFLNRP
jgi:hypothetical protein